ncbi:MAG: hypothetical protein ACFFDF_24400 [Candidatus Odinarchaeota archaeon]
MTEGNIPITSLQKLQLLEFLIKDEIDELRGLIAEELGKRVTQLPLKFKK